MLLHCGPDAVDCKAYDEKVRLSTKQEINIFKDNMQRFHLQKMDLFSN
jgi:hypothetical protein